MRWFAARRIGARKINGGLMKIVTVIARLLLGVVFFVFGLNGFVGFLPMPPLTGTAGAFFGGLFSPPYLFFGGGGGLFAGNLFLVSPFVPPAPALRAPHRPHTPPLTV